MSPSNSYKSLLQELASLSKNDRQSAFRKAQIVQMLIKDQLYKTEYLRTNDDGKVVDSLVGYFSDSAIDMFEAIALIERFPDESYWMKNGTKKLLGMLHEERLRKTNNNRPVHHERTDIVTSLRNTIKELRGENHDLKIENKSLKKRLEKVERLIRT